MAELNPPPQPSPAQPGTHAIPAVRLADDVDALVVGERPAANTLLSTFFRFIGTGRAGRRVSDELLRTALEYGDNHERRLDRRRSQLITWAGVCVLSALVTLVVLVAILRDRTELVKTVFEGVALILSHGAIGAGSYMIGRSRRGSRID